MVAAAEVRVYQLLEQTPKGKVVTYGDIGKVLNIHPRVVGKILHNNPDPSKYPCHRVVFVNGRLSKQYAFGGRFAQREKLEREGVIFKDDRVDMKKCRFALK